MRSHLRIFTVAAVLIATVAACALPTDDSAQVVSGEDVENAMRPTTTSTTRPVGTTQQREMYYYDEDDLLIAEVRPTPLDTDIADILTMLAQPPEQEDWRTTVPEDFLVTTTELEDGVLTVVLADDALFQLGGSEPARAVAQIVLTATGLDSVGIDAVRFELDGERREVPAGPDLTNTDEPVDACDYRQFLPDDVQCSDLG